MVFNNLKKKNYSCFFFSDLDLIFFPIIRYVLLFFDFSVNSATVTWPETTTIVGIGRQRRFPITGLKISIMWWRYLMKDLVLEDWVYRRSNPLEKKLQVVVVIRAGDGSGGGLGFNVGEGKIRWWR